MSVLALSKTPNPLMFFSPPAGIDARTQFVSRDDFRISDNNKPSLLTNGVRASMSAGGEKNINGMGVFTFVHAADRQVRVRVVK